MTHAGTNAALGIGVLASAGMWLLGWNADWNSRHIVGHLKAPPPSSTPSNRDGRPRTSVLAGLGLASLAVLGCGDAGTEPTLSTSGAETSEGGEEGGGQCGTCLDDEFRPCDGGEPIACLDQLCIENVGCRPCVPGTTSCVGNDLVMCDDDGQVGEVVESCDADSVCTSSGCSSGCDAASLDASNVGCEFWAVDLPNTRGLDDASKEPWGVVLTNAGDEMINVLIERNLAPPGSPLSTFVVTNVEIPPDELRRIELPRAELTGWTPDTIEPPGPPGTFLTSNAFRIRATGPIVVYQFNNFTNNFSTDASLLLPSSGLGESYRVLGYPTANPIAGPPPLPQIAGIPDRSHVSIVGVHGNTTVTVRASHKTRSDMISIPILDPGEQYTTTIGPFDVLNIGSDGIPGDLTGTVVESNRPVAVFTSGERAIGPVVTDPPKPPGWDEESGLCCTDHIEEQLFPITSLGTDFVVSRSPLRSSGSWVEPDELRFMGVAATAQVTTNLPPPLDNFTLAPGQVVDTYTTTDTIVSSTEPIVVGQVLVSQTFTTRYLGDPALTIFAPVQQYRDDYIFLVPDTWTENYVVVAAPVGGSFDLDGLPLPNSCVTTSAGTLAGVDYETHRCPLAEGAHRISSVGTDGQDGVRFGLMAYGYGSAGSYAFAGGADIEKIYNPPPIP